MPQSRWKLITSAVISLLILTAAHRRASSTEQALEEQETAELFAEERPQVVTSG